MAYLQKKTGKRGASWEVRFYLPRGKRQIVRLGRVNKRIAETTKARIESLVAAKTAGASIDEETAAWLAKLSDVIHGRIAETGLIEGRKQAADEEIRGRLESLVDRYIQSRAKLKPNTVRNYQTTKRLLVEHFGRDRLVRTIHAGHAKDYREWLVGKYAAATVAREIKRARQFFEYARDCRVIESNPFAKVKAGSQKNTRRKTYISHDVVSRILDALPDNLWRLAFVLGRYGGLRIPSELQRLTWSDIDWAARKMTIRVPKKEHIDGHESRIVPIFPEIETYLRQAFDDASEGSVFILPERFHQDGYVYAGVLRAVERAGVPKWPKLLVNLRASRETELMRQEPAHLVHAWLGNSREVAEDHYLMATDEDFLRAAGKVTLKMTPAALATARQESSPEITTAVSPGIPRDTAAGVPPRGVEPRFSD